MANGCFWHIVKPHQINILAPAVLGDFEQVQHTQKPRLPCQLRSNIRKPDRLDRIHLDLALAHAVPPAHLHMRTHPDPHAARNLAAPNPLAQPPCKHHGEILLRRTAPSPEHRMRGRRARCSLARNTCYCLSYTVWLVIFLPAESVPVRCSVRVLPSSDTTMRPEVVTLPPILLAISSVRSLICLYDLESAVGSPVSG